MAAFRAFAPLPQPLLLAALTSKEALDGPGGDLVRGLQSVPVLVSGAGHDAMAIAEAVPRVRHTLRARACTSYTEYRTGDREGETGSKRNLLCICSAPCSSNVFLESKRGGRDAGGTMPYTGLQQTG